MNIKYLIAILVVDALAIFSLMLGEEIEKSKIKMIKKGKAILYVAKNDMIFDNKCIFVKNNSFIEWYLFSTSEKPLNLVNNKNLTREGLNIIDSIILYRNGIKHAIYHRSSKTIVVILNEEGSELCPYTTIIIS